MAAPVRNDIEETVEADLRVTNERAGEFHRTSALRRDFNLSGKNVYIGVFEADGGPVLTHEAFGNRVQQGDAKADPKKPVPLSMHATHVVGTIAAQSASISAATGMAPDAHVIAFWVKDDAERKMDTADPAIAVSNHSYGAASGWQYHEDARAVCGPDRPTAQCWSWNGDETQFEDPSFGRYTHASNYFDWFAFTHPGRTLVVSAGNHRNVPVRGAWDGWYLHEGRWKHTPHRADSTLDAFDTLTGGVAAAKNVITVGSIDDVDGDLDSSRIRVSEFSSFGPTDDGRIKPDIVANGAKLCSPTYEKLPNGKPNLAAYELLEGTSMATPVVTGTIALLEELSQRQRRDQLSADEAKALLIHTAVSPGPGPNYRTGWGALDAYAAAVVLNGGPGVPKLVTGVTTKPAFVTTLNVQAGNKVKVTLVWSDWHGEVKEEPQLDDPGATLVDDLDLEVRDVRGNRYYPWELDPQNPRASATRCVARPGAQDRCRTNQRDNVEQVSVDSAAESGVWTIRVNAPDSVLRRRFALVVGAFQAPVKPKPHSASPSAPSSC